MLYVHYYIIITFIINYHYEFKNERGQLRNNTYGAQIARRNKAKQSRQNYGYIYYLHIYIMKYFEIFEI